MNPADAQLIAVQLAYATTHEQFVHDLQVPTGTTLGEVVTLSKLAGKFSQLPVEKLVLGVFGRILDPETPVKAGDRVEIYRELIADPKLARRQRAVHARKLSRR